MKQRWLIFGTTALSFALALAVVRFVGVPYFLNNADNVMVTVTQYQNGQVQQEVYHQALPNQAQKILDQIRAGVKLPTQKASCPAAPSQQAYYHYKFSFYHMGKVIATSLADARGCARILLRPSFGNDEYYAWQTAQHGSLWDVLYQVGRIPRPINLCTNAICS